LPSLAQRNTVRKKPSEKREKKGKKKGKFILNSLAGRNGGGERAVAYRVARKTTVKKR